MAVKETTRFRRVSTFYVLTAIIFISLSAFLATMLISAALGTYQPQFLITIWLIGVFLLSVFTVLTMMWGGFLPRTFDRTCGKAEKLPYCFDYTFSARSGILYIDVENGMAGFVSSYNPFRVQIFDACRISGVRSVASAMRGFRLEFRVDKKMVSMPAPITGRSIDSAEKERLAAISKTDSLVLLLNQARKHAERRQAKGQPGVP